MINRRSLITGLISFVAAPAIVRAESLMKVKAIQPATLPIVSFIDNYRFIGYDKGLKDLSAYAITWFDNETNRFIVKSISHEEFYER